MIQQEITRELEHLLQLTFSERGRTGRLDLEAIEMAMRSAMHQAGAAALTELLKFDPLILPAQNSGSCPARAATRLIMWSHARKLC